MNRFHIVVIVISTILVGCKAERYLSPSRKELYPCLSAEGKFGYCNSAGKLVIVSQYDDAELFQNGYAVVGIKGEYGVINGQNNIILSIKYPFVRIFSGDGLCLEVTKKQCNAWWYFGQWKWWPGWSILGGMNGPALLTKVPKAEWQIYVIPGKKVLFTRCQMDDKDNWGTSQYWKKGWSPSQSGPSDIDISSTSRLISFQPSFFGKRRESRYQILTHNFICFINDSNLMIKNENRYRIISETGNRVTQTV